MFAVVFHHALSLTHQVILAAQMRVFHTLTRINGCESSIIKYSPANQEH